jgi:RNA 3'-terminal phosphate cyclase
MVLLPLLGRMGVPDGSIAVDLKTRGFFPRGGGVVGVSIEPIKSLRPIHIVERGASIVSIKGVIVASKNARKDAKAAVAAVRREIADRFGNQAGGTFLVAIEIDTTDSDRDAEGDISKLTPREAKAAAAVAQREGARGSNASDVTHSGGIKSNGDGDGDGAVDRTSQRTTKGLSMKEKRQLHLERQGLFEATMQCQLVLETDSGALFAADALLENSKSRGVVDPDDLVRLSE